MENFRNRMLSNEHEEDHDFIPSDNVWQSIEKEIDDKKDRRKPFFILLFPIVLFLALGSMFIQRSTKDDTSIVTDNSFVNKEALVNIENEHNSPKENHLSYSTSDRNNSINDKNDGLQSQLKTESLSIVKTNQNDNNINAQVQSSSDLLTDQSRFTSDTQKLTVSEIDFTNHAKSSSTLGKANGVSESLAIASSANQRSSVSLGVENIKDVSKESYQQNSRSDKEITKVPFLNPYLISKSLRDDINPPFVKVKPIIADSDWTFGVDVYSSIANYSITDFTGFEQIDFALNGKPSIGYQFTAEKSIAKNIALYAGIGIDNAHFDADYLITVDQSDLSFIENQGSGNTATLAKTIPSLAGGLETSFILNDLPSNLRTSTVNLNLAHDFKTITVPFGARLALFKSSPINAVVSLGIEYTRRLLTIDTGVNVLTANSSEIELTSVAAVDNVTQPFRLNNFSAVTSIAFDYAISNRVSLGVRTGISNPILAVYEDANYTVNAFQFRAGIFANYNFSINKEK